MTTKRTSPRQTSAPAEHGLTSLPVGKQTSIIEQGIEPIPRLKGEDWRQLGSCTKTNPEIFFPEVGEKSAIAKSICQRTCTVLEECLKYALDKDEKFGIWGGMSTRERKRLKREQLEAAERAQLEATEREQETKTKTRAPKRDRMLTLMEQAGGNPVVITETTGTDGAHKAASSAA